MGLQREAERIWGLMEDVVLEVFETCRQDAGLVQSEAGKQRRRAGTLGGELAA